MRLTKLLIVAGLLLGSAGGFFPQTGFAKSIRWESFADGIARAKSENKKVFVLFFARWCAACKSMEGSTFRDPVVIAFLNRDYIPVKVDIDKNRQISQMFRIKSVPDSWFIAANSKILGHREGYIPADQLKALLRLLDEDDSEP